MFFKKGGKGPPAPPADEEKTLLVGRPTPQARLSWPARDNDRTATHPVEPVTGMQPPVHAEPVTGILPPQPRAAPPQPAPRQTRDDERTRLITTQRQAEPAAPDAGAPEAARPAPAAVLVEEPVVGWLVVIAGKGKGRSVEIAAGSSPIGRGEGQRIRLDFGDDQISRENHATLTFDVRSNRFFLNHGGGRNLTYLAGEPVLVPVELKGGEVISIGDTELKFVPFCGPDFSWA